MLFNASESSFLQNLNFLFPLFSLLNTEIRFLNILVYTQINGFHNLFYRFSGPDEWTGCMDHTFTFRNGSIEYIFFLKICLCIFTYILIELIEKFML